MGGSIIKAIKAFKCGWDGKALTDHSHKGLMKCLYKSNVELLRANQTIQSQDVQSKNMQGELAKYVIKEQREKENTGLMDVKEQPIFNPLGSGVKVKDDKKLASDLLEAESNGKDTK